MHIVKDVKYIKGYTLRVTFDNGEERIVDLQNHLNGEIFQPLKNQNVFKQAYVNPDIDTVVWDNGADMSPDFLFEVGIVEVIRNYDSRPVV